MDSISLIITGLLVISMVYLVLRLPLAIFGNLRRGYGFRNGLARNLETLRLSRMLGFLGIEQADYLHQQKGLEIKQQMQRCAHCGDKDRCDELLDHGNTQASVDLGFCANIDELDRLRSDRPS